jgi:methanogenic corrinoid protein MtbC1
MAVLTDVIAPFLEKIGALWADGSLRIAHEHMASAVVRARLWEMLRQIPPAVGSPGMVVAAPSGQWCELGALMVAVVAVDCGWRVHYFGPNLPAEEIAAAVKEKKSRAVALSLSFRSDGRWLAGELEKLSQQLSPEVDLYVGGRGANKLRRRLAAIGIHCLDDLKSFADAISRAVE